MTLHRPITVDPRAAASVIHVGREREPVVIVDGAFGPAAATDLIERAARARFEPARAIGSHYPGLLGPAPTAYVDAMVRLALSLIAAHGGAGAMRPLRARGNFSLVTTPPEALAPEQRVPHVDAADRFQFAVVHYLSHAYGQGTGFFRHRATGYETVDAARWPAFRAAIEPAMAARSGYTTADDDLFERIGAVAPRFDRLLLYRAALLHSGLIAALPEHADDPRRGRLTGNLFLTCAAA